MLLLLPRPPQPLQPIRIYTGDWEPYVGRDLPDAGPLGSLVKQIFRRAGYDPVVEFTDWPGALDATAEGAALAAFPFIRSDDRAQDLVFSEPLLEFRYVLFYRTDGSLRKDALESWSRGELHDPGWRLGVAKGYELWMSLSKEAGDPRTYDTSAEGFEALAAGAIDLFAESELVGRHLLLDPDLQADAAAIEAADVKAGALASSLETLHIIAPRNRRGEKLVAELDRAIAALKSEGLLAEVQQLLDDGEALTPPRARVAMRDVTSAQDADGHAYRLAAGVQAVVLQWPKAFREREADAKQPPTLPDEDRRPLCQIKVASGPLRGRILRVAPEAFELLPPENNP
jgi:polar amino acid transport system substrate-binding protein